MKTNVVTVTLNPALDKTVVIDQFNIGGLNRIRNSRIDPGGKGINVAKVLNKFGQNVKATGLIAGVQGQMLLKFLSQSGIESDFYEIPGETRTNLKVIEEQSNITTEINESGFNVTEKDLNAFKTELSRHLDNASFLVLGGSLPQGVPSDIYYQLIEIAKSKGVRTVLDADREALINGIKAMPYAIKPNIFELEKLTGQKMSTMKEVLRAAKALTEKGIEMIAVSMGAEGALVTDKTDSYLVKTFPITPKSTVGAGDSMVATLVYSILNNFALEKTAQWITTAGTVTASKPGTEVCSLEEVMNSVHAVRVEKI